MAGAFPLPPLRQELRLTRGVPLAGGAPGYVLFDPLRHLFYQLGQLEQRVVALWGRGEAHAVRAALVAEGTAPDDAEDAIVAFHEFALANQLTRPDPGTAASAFAAKATAAKRDWWRWLLDHYLFIRVPLVRPAAFLARTLPYARPIWSRAGIAVLVTLALLGLVLIGRQWDAFTAEFAGLASPRGLFAFAGALLLVKTCHELGHAWTATRYGVRVPAMGVSFLVMVPVLYTDTSGAWRLRAKRQRIAIDAAGIAAELSVAAVALFAWSFLPEGTWRTGAFVLATTSLATSLLVNASPFMRFDGYYILGDLLGVPNLASRAFALMRWRLREALFALGELAPEALPTNLRRTMIGYAAIIFCYRTMLYLGIAALVYHSFFKALGVILFIVEVSVFLARPLVSEAREWHARWPAIVASRRTRITGAIAAAALVACFLPLDRSVSVPAVLTPLSARPLVAGDPARVEQVLVRNGDAVRAGQPLIMLSAADVTLGAAQAQLRIAQLDSQIARAAADRTDLADTGVLTRARAAEQGRLAGFERRRAALTLRADADGRVADLPDGLATGGWTDGKTVLARVVTPTRFDATGYLPEEQAWRLSPGATGRFVADAAGAGSWQVRLDEVGTAALPAIDQPALASVNGGPIAVSRDGRETLKPAHATLALRMVAEARERDAFAQPLVGHVVLPAAGESLITKVVRAIDRVLVREASLE